MKRCCIVGTAPSYRETPWNDPSLEIASLNDAYALGLPRADRWYENHPFDEMWFRPRTMKVVDASLVPPGAYIRPEGHIEWLKKQAETIPVYLQHEPPEGWPANAHRLPIEQIHATFGDDYWASGPSYILAHLYLQGYRDIWITGIHLATEAEYREQRPQFEALINRLLGIDITLTKKDGFRFYQGKDLRVVLPQSSPIMQHGWKYAYEKRPQPKPNPYRDELASVAKEKNDLIRALVHWPEGKDRSHAVERLRRLEIIELDCKQMLQKAAASSVVLTAAVAA